MSDTELASDLERVRRKIDQAKQTLDDLEARLQTAFEQWLKRREREK